MANVTIVPPQAVLHMKLLQRAEGRLAGSTLAPSSLAAPTQLTNASECIRKQSEDGLGGRWGRWGATAGGFGVCLRLCQRLASVS